MIRNLLIFYKNLITMMSGSPDSRAILSVLGGNSSSRMFSDNVLNVTIVVQLPAKKDDAVCPKRYHLDCCV